MHIYVYFFICIKGHGTHLELEIEFHNSVCIWWNVYMRKQEEALVSIRQNTAMDMFFRGKTICKWNMFSILLFEIKVTNYYKFLDI